jgi:hypothetical protein
VKRPSVFFAALVLALALGGCATSRGAGADEAFDFALIGDTPYDAQQTTNLFPNLIRELNRAELAFVVHDGDIKAGGTPCTDELFEERARQFATIRHPLVYIFGDNEWSDCDTGKVRFEPEERLQKLREMFTRGGASLGGKPMRLVRQSEGEAFPEFRENVRWERGGVLFVGLNVVGAANNFGEKEFARRNAANLTWLTNSFAIATERDHRGVMVIMQANPFPEIGTTNRVEAGFRPLVDALARETLAYRKPVVLVHGDSHYFRIDKPLLGPRSKRRIENFTRVETFGNPDVHWLRVTVDPKDPNVFTFRQGIVRENLFRH